MAGNTGEIIFKGNYINYCKRNFQRWAKKKLLLYCLVARLISTFIIFCETFHVQITSTTERVRNG